MGGGRRIKLDIGNIKYKCNLPRFMFTVGEREREREGRVREGAEGMRSPRGVAGTTRRAGPARGSWGALPSTFLSCFTSTLFLTPPFFLPFFSFGLGRKFPQVTSGKEKRLLPSILRILLFENVINRIK